MLRRILYSALFISICILLFSTGYSAADSIQKTNILVLHSYNRGYIWTDQINEAIETTIKRSLKQAEFYTAYMDTKRFSDNEYVRQYYRTFRQKYKGKHIDIIITSDDAAYQFMLEHGDELFPGVPVVFCGVNNFSEEMFKKMMTTRTKQFTGVVEDVDIKSTVETALKLQPDTRQVVVINDTSEVGKALHDQIADYIRSVKSPVKFVFLEDMDIRDIEDRVQSLPKESIVVFLIFFRDRSGRIFTHDESFRMINQHSPVPIYTCWDIYNGLGAVGGLETTGYLQGETAANLALRILKGEKPSSIPVIEHSPKQYMFDYTQLMRFGINPDRLPQGSIVINQPASFYQENRGKVWAVISTILILVVMIVSLIASIQRRKKIEISLRESEERFKSVVDNIAIGVSLISPGMKIIALNRQMREWFPDIDVSRHPVCYDSFNDPPRGEICSYCPTCQTLRDGQVHIAMTETPARDKIIHFRVVSSPVRDKNGAIISAIELVEDITEQKKAEQALIASESKYRSLFEKMINGFALHRIIMDEKGDPVDYVFLEANQAFEKLTGLKREEIIGKRVTEVLAGIENETPGWIKTYGEVALTGKEIRLEGRSDLLGKWYSISAYSPMTHYFVTIFEDITEKKKMEDALLKSEERYRALFEESKDAVFVSTPDGRYLDMNPAGLEIFGYSSREELSGIDIGRDIYVNPEDRTKFQKELDEKGFVKDYEIEMKRKDGKPLTVLSTVTAVRNEQGEIVAYRGIRRDITEHKRLEQQLLQAQKMEAVGQLAGGIAHDFNNILTAIIGYGALLQMKISGQAVVSDYVNQILEAANKAAEVTKSLLAFSRKQMMNPRPVDLNDIVRGIEKLLSRLIGEDIEITTTLSGKDAICMVDVGQMEQVLMNLTTNARDAMPNGGRLTLKTEMVEFDETFVRSHGYGEPGRYAVLSVSDTGVGMNQEAREKIFEPFFTTKETGKGTGLGLAMVYGIIKQHGGHINVYSEPGEGTTFKIYLPAAQSKEEGHPAGPTETRPTGGTETILVAEDDDKLRQLSEIILAQNGYTVISARDGEDAVNKFIGHKDEIQLVIVDMIMPRKSGKEAYDEIKAVRPDIKVLFSSGYTGDRIDIHSLGKEELSFINKPVSPKDLLRKVREILDK